MKYMMFRTRYMPKHPRAGELTNFMEKMWNNRCGEYPTFFAFKEALDGYASTLEKQVPGVFSRALVSSTEIRNCSKGHTIRPGSRWKAGDVFSPRVWSGKPYASPQEEFMPPISVVATYAVKIQFTDQRKSLVIWLNNNLIQMMPVDQTEKILQRPIAHNDGLLPADFIGWFSKPFEGQLICWDAEIARFYDRLIKT